MLCEHCGTDNLDEALNCSQCGADLGDPATRLQEARARRKRRYETRDPRVTAPARGRWALLLGVIGAYTLISFFDAEMHARIILLAIACGAVGLWLGLSSVRDLRMVDGVSWKRAVSSAGALVSACVLAAPVLAILVTVARIPSRIAHEPMALNNMRKLSAALQGYMEDNDGRLPGWASDAAGRPHHNVWDEQLAPLLRGDATYINGIEGRGFRSLYQRGPRTRVLSYGLNGLLITRRKPAFDGNADWASGPASVSLDNLSDPAATIVFAELATNAAVAGSYTLDNDPAARPRAGDSRNWRNGLAHWIDIDPRAWVETGGPVKSYERGQWDEDRGVGRALHAGGACYAFADGHVGYSKLLATVTGGFIGIPMEQRWSASNSANMWVPR